MSLDIYLHDQDGDEIAWMNWLRNPFGLERWLSNQTGVSLWHVVNDHAYDDSENVDRVEFLAKAREAKAAVDALERAGVLLEMDWACAYSTTRDLIRRGMPARVCQAKGEIAYDGRYRCRVYAWVWCEDFQAFLPSHERDSFRGVSLEDYRGWTAELLDFAERLQDPTTTYYCSN